jgi:glycosyltransferase involved in cell wall biosynthesis
LVTVGSSVRDDLLAAGVGSPEKYRVIPPGIEIGPLPTKQSARRVLGIPETGPVLSFIGRVTRIKRPDRFIEVALRVSQQRPDAHFIIVGDGDLMQVTRHKAACSNAPIQLLGMLNQVETCLAASDAVILTSDNEGTPISLIEAGMAGIPVVASDVGSVREVVSDGETGWLAKPDTTALSAAVLELLQHPSEAARRGENARKTTEQKFGVSRFLGDYEQLYIEVANDGRNH